MMLFSRNNIGGRHHDTILWNVYGKIREVRYAGGQPVLRFMYDASGHRTGKLLINSTTGRIDRGDLYWRDAQGNALVVEQYRSQQEEGEHPYVAMKDLETIEYSIYGSSRLGIKKDTVTETYQADELSTRGTRQYELANHLGNVMVTVGDYKQADTADEDLYASLVLTAQDYYPFGMQMPGRKYILEGNSSLNGYRYSFNGKEDDSEVAGQQDYGVRLYDSRLGRFKSADPIIVYGKQYPELSPYQFASNTPVQAIDLDGLERYNYTRKLDDQGNVILELQSVEDIYENVFDPHIGKDGVRIWRKVKNPKQVHRVWQQGTTIIIRHHYGPVRVYYDEHVDYATYEAAQKSKDEDFKSTSEDNQMIFVNALNGAADEAMQNSYSRGISGGRATVNPKAKLAVAAKGVSNIGFKELQALVRADSKAMDAFFKSKGSVVPSKEALLNYKELATRMLNGTGGAYQRVTEAAAKLHTERIEMINDALKSLK